MLISKKPPDPFGSGKWIPKKPPDLRDDPGGNERKEKGREYLAGTSRSGSSLISCASLFRRTSRDDDWRFSAELCDKIKGIEETAKGRVKIVDEDIEAVNSVCNLVLYGKFFRKTPLLEPVPQTEA
ncbi:hypothetical protein Cni_G21980 [Canna indica]|uniref:Uncharacterized protein n=1 Tax=Canna indica TaxID=4628 RepID=A0AAQ3KVZ1_9LILI|nr:hypothetical protein Cni_G21980 [Canna indica]